MTRILAIESSCDETAAAVVEDGRRILSNVIATQIPVHRIYGGVVPEIAGRRHLEAISPVVREALDAAGCGRGEVDAVAVTAGPGLVGSLLVGVSYAKALAQAWDKPLIAVHHWLGHLQAARLEHQLEPPFLALVASGSHSGLIEVTAEGRRFLGRSRDDAAGEAFDKIARALGLPYPGGPEIARAAREGDPEKYDFPRAWLEESDDFSFSGLKSAVLNHLNHRRMTAGDPDRQEVCDIAASAQEAICDVLSAKAVAAARRHGLPLIVLAGGVAANARLRELLLARA
ncbi:MAG: tRNA (adenosine(37)-N6)-threonylcarbamoyltransferase complex transferase subunit TsaD, partial [Firmicutes bacterium]|nr:tRNA (adenosine(37)-N6)-threonylcarbamoyltransferase complex transferase subunit TsaD [Bacillota bacterium]